MVFTSAKGSPSTGDWGNITVDGGNGSLLENIELRYSGNGGLIFNHSSATEIRNATFEHNAEGALHYQNSDNNKIIGSIFKYNSNTKSLQFENENGYTGSYEHAAGLTLYLSENNLVESSNSAKTPAVRVHLQYVSQEKEHLRDLTFEKNKILLYSVDVRGHPKTSIYNSTSLTTKVRLYT